MIIELVTGIIFFVITFALLEFSYVKNVKHRETTTDFTDFLCKNFFIFVASLIMFLFGAFLGGTLQYLTIKAALPTLIVIAVIAAIIMLKYCLWKYTQRGKKK